MTNENENESGSDDTAPEVAEGKQGRRSEPFADAGDLGGDDADPALGGLPAGAKPLGLIVGDEVVSLDDDYKTKLQATAIRWRDTGSRYRTQCAYEMLGIFGLDLPELPPMEGGVDPHVKIPIGELIANLDVRVNEFRAEIIRRSRALAAQLTEVAMGPERAQDLAFTHEFGLVSERGVYIDRLCVEFAALKELRDRMLRVANRERARARAERRAQSPAAVPRGEPRADRRTATASDVSGEDALPGQHGWPFED